MKYREILDLTDDEIIFIVNDIFNPLKVENITRNNKWNSITCDITTTWGDGTEEFPYIDAVDELELKEDNLSVDFSLHGADLKKWKQFLLAKGCNWLLKDNPYISDK